MKLFVLINKSIKDVSIIKNYFNSTSFSTTYLDYSEDLSEYTKLVSSLNHDTSTKVVVFATSGVGEFLVSNKISLLRAASIIDEFTAKCVVSHNNVQVIILPLTIISVEYAIKLIDIFFSNIFEGGRHNVRINILNKLC